MARPKPVWENYERKMLPALVHHDLSTPTHGAEPNDREGDAVQQRQTHSNMHITQRRNVVGGWPGKGQCAPATGAAPLGDSAPAWTPLTAV
jgi:hypothetical protein